MRALLLTGLLLAAPAALAAPVAAPPDARAHKEIGDQRRKAGDAEGALEAYRTALKKFGGYAEAYEAMGEVQYGQKRFAEAIASFGYAVEIDPAYALAWYNMAFAARKSGDLPRARAAYEQYARLRPADADGHFGLAETLRGLDEREAAARQYQLFIDLAKATPSQAAWVEKARGHLAALKAPPPAPAAAPSAASTALPVAAALGAGAAIAASGAEAAGAAPASPVAAVTAASGVAPAATPAATPNPAATSAAAPAVTPASMPAASPAAPPAAAASPPVLAAAPAAAAAAPAAIPTDAPAVPAPPPLPAARAVEPVPTQALIDKLGAGDRATLAGDHRAALFLFQDATYLEPASATARLRLARTYQVLRHPDKAEAQLRQVLAQYPDHAEAARLLEELKNPPARPAGAAAGAAPVGVAAVAAGAVAVGAAGGSQSGRVYKFTPEADGASPLAPLPARPGAATSIPAPPPPPAPPAEAGPSGADLYRAGVEQVARREFAQAVDTFSRALERSPDLAVAYEARASARFGLGLYREAALDYQKASERSPQRASPLWGLAECQRLLGDARAAETYGRYAESTAADVVDRQRDAARVRVRELRDR